MFSTISWGQYITFLIVAAICYYCFVGYKYYRWEILNIIGIKRIEPGEVQIPVAEIKKQFIASSHADFMPRDNTRNIFQSFADEVKAYLYEASTSAPKEEIIFALQQIVSKYPDIKNSESRADINEFILRETEKHYQGFLQADDLLPIWL